MDPSSTESLNGVVAFTVKILVFLLPLLFKNKLKIDFHLKKKKTFCTASFTVKNLRTSLDVQKQSFLFSGDSRWPARD